MIYTQLPETTMAALYCKFLFVDFLEAFNRFFSISKDNGYQHAHYTFEDQDYANMMLIVLSSLECIVTPKDTVIFQELDEITQMYFYMEGIFDIGFEINRVPNPCIRFKNCSS